MSILVAELEEKLAVAEAQVKAAYEYANLLSGFCSPHGVATDYANQLTQALDAAKSPEKSQD